MKLIRFAWKALPFFLLLSSEPVFPKNPFKNGEVYAEYPKGCAYLQCERGDQCVNRKFWCKNPPCPSMLYCSKTRKESLKGPTTCDSVRCSKGYVCLVRVRRCRWDQKCKQQIARCVSEREYYEGPATCADFRCPTGHRCILRESLCTQPPCKLLKSCAKNKDVQIWFERCKNLGCPSEHECFLRRPVDNCPKPPCKHTPDCTTTNDIETPVVEQCRGWVCPPRQECSAHIQEPCDPTHASDDCKVNRACHGPLIIPGSSPGDRATLWMPTIATTFPDSGSRAASVKDTAIPTTMKRTLAQMERDLILQDQEKRRQQSLTTTTTLPTSTSTGEPQILNVTVDMNDNELSNTLQPMKEEYNDYNFAIDRPIYSAKVPLPFHASPPTDIENFQNMNTRIWSQGARVPHEVPIYKSPVYFAPTSYPKGFRTTRVSTQSKVPTIAPLSSWLDHLRLKTGVDAIEVWVKQAQNGRNFGQFRQWLKSVKDALGPAPFESWLEEVRRTTVNHQAFQTWLPLPPQRQSPDSHHYYDQSTHQHDMDAESLAVFPGNEIFTPRTEERPVPGDDKGIDYENMHLEYDGAITPEPPENKYLVNPGVPVPSIVPLPSLAGPPDNQIRGHEQINHRIADLEGMMRNLPYIQRNVPFWPPRPNPVPKSIKVLRPVTPVLNALEQPYRGVVRHSPDQDYELDMKDYLPFGREVSSLNNDVLHPFPRSEDAILAYPLPMQKPIVPPSFIPVVLATDIPRDYEGVYQPDYVYEIQNDATPVNDSEERTDSGGFIITTELEQDNTPEDENEFDKYFVNLRNSASGGDKVDDPNDNLIDARKFYDIQGLQDPNKGNAYDFIPQVPDERNPIISDQLTERVTDDGRNLLRSSDGQDIIHPLQTSEGIKPPDNETLNAMKRPTANPRVPKNIPRYQQGLHAESEWKYKNKTERSQKLFMPNRPTSPTPNFPRPIKIHDPRKKYYYSLLGYPPDTENEKLRRYPPVQVTKKTQERKSTEKPHVQYIYKKVDNHQFDNNDRNVNRPIVWANPQITRGPPSPEQLQNYFQAMQNQKLQAYPMPVPENQHVMQQYNNIGKTMIQNENSPKYQPNPLPPQFNPTMYQRKHPSTMTGDVSSHGKHSEPGNNRKQPHIVHQTYKYYPVKQQNNPRKRQHFLEIEPTMNLPTQRTSQDIFSFYNDMRQISPANFPANQLSQARVKHEQYNPQNQQNTRQQDYMQELAPDHHPQYVEQNLLNIPQHFLSDMQKRQEQLRMVQALRGWPHSDIQLSPPTIPMQRESLQPETTIGTTGQPEVMDHRYDYLYSYDNGEDYQNILSPKEYLDAYVEDTFAFTTPSEPPLDNMDNDIRNEQLNLSPNFQDQPESFLKAQKDYYNKYDTEQMNAPYQAIFWAKHKNIFKDEEYGGSPDLLNNLKTVYEMSERAVVTPEPSVVVDADYEYDEDNEIEAISKPQPTKMNIQSTVITKQRRTKDEDYFYDDEAQPEDDDVDQELDENKKLDSMDDEQSNNVYDGQYYDDEDSHKVVLKKLEDKSLDDDDYKVIE